MTTSPVQQDIFGVLAPFIVAVTGYTAVPLTQSLVLQQLPNRASMPAASPGFAVMTFIRKKRLRTNINTWVQSDPTTISHESGTEVVIQVDFYGATSEDWATAFETLFRDDSGFQALSPVCAPLHADDAHMAPLDDSEEQYEQRWVVEAYLQYNPTTADPMQFAETVKPILIDVQQKFPPS